MQWLPSDSYFTKSLTFSKNIPADEVCLEDFCYFVFKGKTADKSLQICL